MYLWDKWGSCDLKWLVVDVVPGGHAFVGFGVLGECAERDIPAKPEDIPRSQN